MRPGSWRAALFVATAIAVALAGACGSFGGSDVQGTVEASDTMDADGASTVADASPDGAAPGATCDGGPCMPVRLLTGEDQPLHVAVRNGSVFWALQNGTIRGCVADSCAATVRDVAAGYPNAGVPGGIAIDDAWVYWTLQLNSLVMRASTVKAGKLETVADFGVGGGHYPFEIAADGTHVYWTTESPDEVRSCATAAPCSADASAVIATSSKGFTAALAMSDTKLFWTSGDNGDSYGNAFEVAKDGGQPTVLTYMIPGPREIAAHGGSAFATSWLSPDGGSVGVVYRFFGTTTDVLASGQAQPGAIVTDETSVYWANKGDGTIRRCAIAGCSGAPTLVASSTGAPESLAIDGPYLYWCDSINGDIYRIIR